MPYDFNSYASEERALDEYWSLVSGLSYLKIT